MSCQFQTRNNTCSASFWVLLKPVVDSTPQRTSTSKNRSKGGCWNSKLVEIPWVFRIQMIYIYIYRFIEFILIWEFRRIGKLGNPERCLEFDWYLWQSRLKTPSTPTRCHLHSAPIRRSPCGRQRHLAATTTVAPRCHGGATVAAGHLQRRPSSRCSRGATGHGSGPGITGICFEVG